MFSFHGHAKKFDRKDASAIISKVHEKLRMIGMQPNLSKTTVVPPGSRKIVLGLCVNDTKPRLTRTFKKNLETHAHYVCRFGIVKHSRKRGFDSVIGCRAHLKGLLRFAHSVEPEFVKRIEARLDTSDWDQKD